MTKTDGRLGDKGTYCIVERNSNGSMHAKDIGLELVCVRERAA